MASIDLELIDIRAHSREDAIRDEIIAGLSRPEGQKSVSAILLYDERGLRLYDELTTEAPEYYLFADEERILKRNADEIVSLMRGGPALVDSIDVVELGAGALRKTSIVLEALSQQISEASSFPSITYYALDLEKSELDRTLTELNRSDVGTAMKGKVAIAGLWGTYDDGIKFIKDGGLANRHPVKAIDTAFLAKDSVKYVADDAPPSPYAPNVAQNRAEETKESMPFSPGVHVPLSIMFLGSSLGNFPWVEAAAFLKSLPLRPGSGDTLLLGLDHTNDAEKIWVAYNEPKGIARNFIMNGLVTAGRALGDEHLFDRSKWEYITRFTKEIGRHEAYLKSTCDQIVVDPVTKTPLSFVKDETFCIAMAHKYSEKDTYALFVEAELRPIRRWTDSICDYSLWLLDRPDPSSVSLPAAVQPLNMSSTSDLKE